MKIQLLFIVLVFSFVSYAQTQDALVFFTDKENVQTSLDNPISILTQRALDRKNRHQTPIDVRDVPVNEAYISEIKAAPGISVHSKSKWMNCVYVRGTQSAIESLLSLAFVESIEFSDKDLNTQARFIAFKNKFSVEDSSQRVVYNYGTADNQIKQLSAHTLHERDFTGTGMVVAVMDSGFPMVDTNIAFSNARAEGRMLGTYDFVLRREDATGDGTHGVRTFSDIAGFIDGVFVGTAPKASYYLFRTEDGPNESPLEEAFWLEALERADSLGVDVVNTSLGYKNFDNPNYNHSFEDLDGKTTIGARAGNLAFDKGMLLVTSAGNDGGTANSKFIGTPGDSPGMLTIGSVTSTGAYSSFSSIGPTVDGRIKPDVMAQGSNAAVIEQFGNPTFSSGTSFSSPIMAGAITCLWQAYPDFTNAQIMQLVRESGSTFNNPTPMFGYGIPNFENAFLAAQALSVEDVLRQSNFAVSPNPATSLLNISFPQNIERAEIRLYSILGKQVLRVQVSVNQPSINITSLPKGIYLVTITSANATNSFKIVKN